MPYDDFREVLRQEAVGIAADAAAQGAASRHGPSIGTGRESALADRLQSRFPWIRITRGEIASADAGPSGEWDLILYDEQIGGPISGVTGAHVVPIETVRAVISVKSDLRSDSISSCADAAAALRRKVPQEYSDVLVPAVFAFGFAGIKSDTLATALAAAAAAHGAFGRIDGVVVLGERLARPDATGYTVENAGGDAYGAWVVALQQALRTAPRLELRLADYFGPPPPRGDSPPEEPDTGGPPAAPTPPDKPSPPAGGRAAPADAEDASTRVEASLAARPTGTDLLASTTLAQLREDLRHRAPDDLDAFEDALGGGVVALREIASAASGQLLRAIGWALLIVGEDAVGVEAFERYAAEAPADRTEALAIAAASCFANDERARGDRLLTLAEDDEDPAIVVARAVAASGLDRAKLLEVATPQSAWQRRLVALLRARTLNEQERFAEAAAVARPSLHERWSLALADQLSVSLLRSVARTPEDERSQQDDEEALTESVGVLLDAAADALTLGESDQAMLFDAALVGALAKLRRLADVVRVVRWWIDEADVRARDAAARTTLASTLLDVQMPELAATVAPERDDTDPERRLLALRLDLHSGDSAVVTSAVVALDQMLEQAIAAGEDAETVAHVRAQAAAEHDAEWSERAATVLGERSPFYRDMLLAAHLTARGRVKEAETALLPYADTATGIRALIDVAVEAGDPGRVITLIDALGADAPPIERLRRADALERLPDAEAAEGAWRDLARSPSAPPPMRGHAWFRLVSSLVQRQQWERLAVAAVEWVNAFPASTSAPWVAADALARTGRPREGLDLLRTGGYAPVTEQQRRLLAQLAADALPVAEAAEAIAALSDEVDREDERLEALLFTVSVGRDKESISGALEERLRLTFADFTDRFPDSPYVRRVQAPKTDEDWARFAAEHLAQRRAWARQMHDAVARGESALAVMALLGTSPLEVWLDSNLLPLAAPIGTARESEIADAEAAIAGPAAWDSSALAVLSLLPEATMRIAANALPASLAARAVRHELHAAQNAPGRDQDRARGTLAWDDVEARPVLWTDTKEAAAARAARLDRVARLLDRLTIADPDITINNEAAAALRDEELDRSADSWLGAIALALERDIPLYCDDRYIRAWARGLGLRTFGTVALVEALSGRSAIDDAARDEAMWSLRGAGGRHVRLRPGELVKRIERDDFRLTWPVAATLRDPDGWRNDPTHSSLAWLEALTAVWRHDAGFLGDWLGEVIGQLAASTGASTAALAGAFLVPALLTDRDVARNRALLSAMRRCEREQFHVGDVVMAALTEILRAGRQDDPQLVQQMFVRALAALPITEQLRVLERGGGA